MEKDILHSFKDEIPESNARWFQSISINERMDMLCSFTDMILDNNPSIVERRDAKSATGRIQVLIKHKVKYLVIEGVATTGITFREAWKNKKVLQYRMNHSKNNNSHGRCKKKL